MTDTRAAIEAAIQKIVVWIQSDPTWKEATTLQSILTRLIDKVTAGERERLTNAAVRWWLANTPTALSQHEINGHEQDLRRALSSPPTGEWGKLVLTDLLAEVRRLTPEEYSRWYNALPLPCEGCESRPECDAHDAPPSGGRETGIHRLAVESRDMDPQIVDVVNKHFWELLDVPASPPAAAAPGWAETIAKEVFSYHQHDPGWEGFPTFGIILSLVKQGIEKARTTLPAAPGEKKE